MCSLFGVIAQKYISILHSLEAFNDGTKAAASAMEEKGEDFASVALIVGARTGWLTR